MEQRIPRTSPILDAPDASASRPKPTASAHAPTRSISRRKLLQAGALSTGGLLVLAGVSWGWNAAKSWLAVRPAYRCRFADIQLQPPPPAWIKRGAEALLAKVRQDSGLPVTLDSQAIDLAVLRRAFAHHSPWVLEVLEVRRAYPNQLTIHLSYREPVLEVVEKDGQQERLIALLDGEAVVLPHDETEISALGPLLRVQPTQVPTGLREGLAWPDGSAEGRPDPVMAEVARLAGFVKHRNKALGARAIPFQQIHALPKFGIFLGATEKRWVRWRTSILPEASPELSDERKWMILEAWVEERRPWPPFRPAYLEFVDGALRVNPG